MLEFDAQFAVAIVEGVIIERGIAQLVASVGGIGNQLAQEDLPVGVQGVNHQVQQLLHLGLEAQGFLVSGRGHGSLFLIARTWAAAAATHNRTVQQYGGHPSLFKRRGVPARPTPDACARWPPAALPTLATPPLAHWPAGVLRAASDIWRGSAPHVRYAGNR